MGSVLAVTGGAGSGKTWLCESMAESAADEGFRVGWGAGWPGGGVPPLWPWQQAVGPFAEPAESQALFGTPPDVADPEWFTRCVAVVDHLRGLASDQPTLLIIDDAHDADEPTRRLAWFVARHVRGLPLVLVATHQPSDALADLDHEAKVIALHGLEPDDASALLTGRGIDVLSDGDLAFVLDATGGRPGDLHRLAGIAGDGAGVVAALVDEQVGDLPADVARAAAQLAVAGLSTRMADVAALGIDALATAAHLERRGLARREPMSGGLTFGHEQVRTALLATLAPDEVLDVHMRLARLLADLPPSLDRLHRRAGHALAAAGRSAADARLAVQAVQDVAAALVDANEPERAAELLASADATHETAGLGPVPAALLAALGRALLRCGHLATAREQFHRAVAAAEKEGDARSLTLGALGLGGVWLAEERSPIERERYLQLLCRARRELPDHEVTLRLRIDVRYAAEEAYETGHYEEIEAQVAVARSHGDPKVLAEALSLQHHAMLGPEAREERADIVEEMISVAARADDDAASLMALLWLTVDQFLAGSPRAERTLRDLHERAAAQPGRHAAYIAQVMDVMLLQREGRLDEAERAAEAAFVAGTQVGDADALAYYGGQLVTMRWIQGRTAEVLELAASTEASPTVTPMNQGFTASFACLAASCGELDRARAALSRLKGGLQAVHQSSAWLVTLYAVVEAAYLLEDVDAAREAAVLLAPYADLPVVGSLGVSCVGSVRRSLGLAAVTAGNLATGIELLERAVADNERLGNRPLAAMTAVELARARIERGAEGDREAAMALLDQAIRQADIMDLPVRAEEWRAQRAELAGHGVPPLPATGVRAWSGVGPVWAAGSPDGGAGASGRPGAGAGAGSAGVAGWPGTGAGAGVGSAGAGEVPPGVPLDHEVGTIRRRGRSWVLGVAGRDVVVADLLGMGYLVQLLTNPGVEIAAAALVSDGSDTSAVLVSRPEQPVLDDAALAAYRHRVAELEDDLDEAERNADPERASRAKIELDAVIDELTRTTNRFGRPRQFSSSNERARTAVQKAVRRALDNIDEADPPLGAALRRSVRTGRTCVYDPGPGAPARWSRPDPPAD